MSALADWLARVGLVLEPQLPAAFLAGLAVFALAAVVLALWRGLVGWALRGLAALTILAALAGPALEQQTQKPLNDIVLMIEDRSASQSLADRPEQMRAAGEIATRISALPNTELRRITLGDAPENGGTRLGAALAEALAAEPRGRVAGAIVLSDGQAHDMADAPEMPGPVHLLLTGQPQDWDRRLVLENAPAFGLIGQDLTLRLLVRDEGAVPASAGQRAMITLSIDGDSPTRHEVPVDTPLELPLRLEHGGQNVVQITIDPAAGELTQSNNAAAVQINGVRDRLRVLLISGEPHAGERTWRNLLKSDPAVDLVHFTILRPPEKQDGVPVDELALIAFPVQELFEDKIDEFDLIVFDRYAQRGILPLRYFDNLRGYVEDGGALLVAAGPEFAGVESLAQSPIGDLLPARPTGRVLEGAFLPRLTPEGVRHPVTSELPQSGEDGDPAWGRWLRQVELRGEDGTTVMTGAEDSPLLVLSRAGKGRVALLASDQAWLWARGFEGGGPQLELLRRIAHWSMKEPDLEEETLMATPLPGGQGMAISRRTMAREVGPVTIISPDGQSHSLPLTEGRPGSFTARWSAPGPGLYRLFEGDAEAVVALGPAFPREFENALADATPMAGLITATGGTVVPLSEGLPTLRKVSEGRSTFGPGWIGLLSRGVSATTDIRRAALLPAWAWLALAAGLALLGWLAEGWRRGGKA